MPQENGFLTFYSTGVGTYCGTMTRENRQLPAVGGGSSGCWNQPAGNPAQLSKNLVAAMWTNLRVAMPWETTAGTCWDAPAGPTTELGHIWVQPATGVAPLNYVVIEYDRVLVNTDDSWCKPSPTPNHYATFQFKVWLSTGNIDVIYKSVDHNNQPFTMGIQNGGYQDSSSCGIPCVSPKAVGLNYCSPIISGQCDAASPNFADLAVRYYPDHGTPAVAGTVTINEDCTDPALVSPTVSPCSAVSPNNFVSPAGGDPDYGDNGGAGTLLYCISTPPTRGKFTPAQSCPSYGPAPVYTPYLNYNGIAPGPPNPPDSYRYQVKDGAATSASALVTVTINPVNDAPAAKNPQGVYNVLSDDSVFVPATSGLLVGGTDPEIGSSPAAGWKRNSWGCAVPPGSYPCSSALMTEQGPFQTLTAAMTSCPGYSSATWDPQHGAVTYINSVGATVPGVATSGAFRFTANTYTGPDSFKYCLFDGTLYSPPATVNINIAASVAGYSAKADLFIMNEGSGPLVAEGAAAPSANDVATACSSGLQYDLVGAGPANAASFVWDTASGSFVYTPFTDFGGDDSFTYRMNCGGGPVTTSNTAIVQISVLPINDAPKYDPSTYMSWGDIINEDNGIISSTPAPYTRTVANFMTAIGPGGGSDELPQQIRPVIVSQSNTGLFTSVVPCPANFDFAVVASACPTTLGPALILSGPVGNQVITLKYTTKPDANGVDKVCFRLTDDGGTTLGGMNQNTMPPAEPLCFNIKILPIADAPRPVADTYTIYQGHELYAAAPAVTFPGPMPAVYTLLKGNPGGLTPDLEVDGETVKTFVSTQPGYGKLWYLYNDGTFHYTPPPSYPRVVTGSPSIGTAITSIAAIGSEKSFDADGSGAFTPGDKMYIDFDTTNTVTAKDVRLTWHNSYPAGSIVVATDADVGFPLAATDHTVTCYYDADANGAFSAVDPIYLQVGACGPSGVAPGALRLSAGAAGAGGSVVKAGDADVGRATVVMATKYCYQQKDAVAGYSTGDWVYLDMGSCSSISLNDVLLTWGTQTFNYFIQDSSGSNSPSVVVTIRILGNTVPVAGWTTTTTEAGIGDLVTFASSCTDEDSDDQGSLVSYWDFGDGHKTTGKTINHAFAMAGTYTITFYCYDIHGDVSIVSHTIRVVGIGGETGDEQAGEALPDGSAGTAPLEALAGEDLVAVEGTQVMLAGAGSGSPTTWSWTQVSGTPVTLADKTTPTSTFMAPMIEGMEPETLVFVLAVGDGTSTSIADTVNVQVVSDNAAPTVLVIVPQAIHEGDMVTLDGSGTTDADGDALTYKWTFLAGPAVTVSGAETATATFTVPEGSLGRSFVFALEASDGKSSGVDSVPLLVTAKVFTGPGFTTELGDGGLVTVTPLVDADNYVWDFGDASAPATSTGSTTHTYAQAGDYTIYLTAQGADGAVRTFQQGVPISLDSSVHDASRPGEAGPGNATLAAWMLAAGAVVLTAAVVGLAIVVQKRKR